MRRRGIDRVPAAALALVVVASLAVADVGAAQSVEINPYGGYRWGGELDADDNALFDEDVELDESGVYGIRLDVAVSRGFQIELLASRQETEFAVDEELFGDDADLLDVQLDTYHIGVLWQGGSGQVHPFAVTSVGVTSIDPDLPSVSSEDRLSASFGGGVKVFLNPHVGFRFEGRFFWTDIDEDDDRDHDDDCCDVDYGDDLYQGEVTAGLVVAF